ncbi:hypothetical protein LXL04_006469 [Taraxacum kok-saghyz]
MRRTRLGRGKTERGRGLHWAEARTFYSPENSLPAGFQSPEHATRFTYLRFRFSSFSINFACMAINFLWHLWLPHFHKIWFCFSLREHSKNFKPEDMSTLIQGSVMPLLKVLQRSKCVYGGIPETRVHSSDSARVVFNTNGILYPDSVFDTDSHTSMVDGLGVAGWGVGGMEAEAAMLGQGISMVLPGVVVFELSGSLKNGVTATDLVLTVAKMLRKHGVVGNFVEFYGEGMSEIALPDRATIANMSKDTDLPDCIKCREWLVKYIYVQVVENGDVEMSKFKDGNHMFYYGSMTTEFTTESLLRILQRKDSYGFYNGSVPTDFATEYIGYGIKSVAALQRK